MRNQTMQSVSARCLLTSVVIGLLCTASGCHDGPLYALKHANPYYAMKEWREDDDLGVTDHERRNQLMVLANSIDRLPANRQAYWATHLKKMIELDPNPEMRRLAISAAGRMQTASAIGMIEQGLQDDSIKVRMEACRALGNRRETKAATLLASTFGSETEIDVKHAALEAMGNQKNKTLVNAARIALNDRNPATQSLAMESLRGITGKDYGDRPDAWLKAIGTPDFGEESDPGTGAPATKGPSEQIAEGIYDGSTVVPVNAISPR